jgi:hypothetical protein
VLNSGDLIFKDLKLKKFHSTGREAGLCSANDQHDAQDKNVPGLGGRFCKNLIKF